MNKRHVLYFRGQRTHYDKCLPVLFRDRWYLEGTEPAIALTTANRPRYLEVLREVLRPCVFAAVKEAGTPREDTIEILPAATASILQHYEAVADALHRSTRRSDRRFVRRRQRGARKLPLRLWNAGPTRLHHDRPRPAPDALAARGHLSARCQAPHHQDAYLIARAPEPHNSHDGELWADWENKSDLMRRLVAKFELPLTAGLRGAPQILRDYLVPAVETDSFWQVLHKHVLPVVRQHVGRLVA